MSKRFKQTPLEVNIKCRHRKAKTRRLGLCPKCYLAYRKIVSPESIERIKQTQREQWKKHHELRLENLRQYHKRCPKWKVRDRWLRNKYGITIYQYTAMVKAQGYVCKICGVAPTRLHTDHCHITGRVRGLLCWKCNRGLQFFKDDPKLFLLSAAYLQDKFDGRHLIVKRKNFLADLSEEVIKHGIVHVKDKIVVMTADTFHDIKQRLQYIKDDITKGPEYIGTSAHSEPV